MVDLETRLIIHPRTVRFSISRLSATSSNHRLRSAASITRAPEWRRAVAIEPAKTRNTAGADWVLQPWAISSGNILPVVIEPSGLTPEL